MDSYTKKRNEGSEPFPFPFLPHPSCLHGSTLLLSHLVFPIHPSHDSIGSLQREFLTVVVDGKPVGADQGD